MRSPTRKEDKTSRARVQNKTTVDETEKDVVGRGQRVTALPARGYIEMATPFHSMRGIIGER
jgi:hypothetical protein